MSRRTVHQAAGRAVALGYGRTITPVFAITVTHTIHKVGNVPFWFVHVTVEPVHIIVSEPGETRRLSIGTG